MDMAHALLSVVSAAVAAIASAVAAAMAWLAIRDARAGRAEERRAVRPYFSFSLVKAWDGFSDGKYHIEATLKNVGPRPAWKVTRRVLIIDCGLSKDPLLQDNFEVQEVLQDNTLEWHGQIDQQLGSDLPEQYLVVTVEYDDPMTRESYNQLLVMKWGGVSGGKARGLFREVSQKELKIVQKTVARFMNN